jgi:8-oxo-dGTP diphosphatase
VRRGDEVLLVHRPKYDDWTLPKGKLDRGESFEDAALREVEEETGFVCELGEEVGSTTYHDRHGRLKLVRYWEMSVLEGEFEPNDEVDELRWVPAKEARSMLSYERDRDVIPD